MTDTDGQPDIVAPVNLKQLEALAAYLGQREYFDYSELVFNAADEIDSLRSEVDRMQALHTGLMENADTRYDELCRANRDEIVRLRSENAALREAKDAAVRLWNDCGDDLLAAQAVLVELVAAQDEKIGRALGLTPANVAGAIALRLYKAWEAARALTKGEKG